MVRGYHIIFSTYGFWLPNDPRGSRSDWVRAPAIRQFGPATKAQTRRSLAHEPHDPVVRQLAKRSLKYPPVVFDGRQARGVARGFARAIEIGGYVIHACAILPEHVHLVVARHALPIERIIAHLKKEATMRLFAEGIQPLEAFRKGDRPPPSPWSQKKGWLVYLNDDAEIRQRIEYVEKNPLKEGKKRQEWWFVTPFGRG
jgi:REP element-mobilizing transposase RayT